MRIHRIRRAHPQAAREIEVLLGEPTKLLSSILIGNTLVNMASAVVGYEICEWFWPGRGAAISIPVMTALLIVFSEITPKRLAVRFPEKLAVAYRLP